MVSRKVSFMSLFEARKKMTLHVEFKTLMVGLSLMRNTLRGLDYKHVGIKCGDYGVDVIPLVNYSGGQR